MIIIVIIYLLWNLIFEILDEISFKKEQMFKEQWERFALGHKKGKHCQERFRVKEQISEFPTLQFLRQQ